MPRSGCPATIEKHPDSGTVIPSLPASPNLLEFSFCGEYDVIAQAPMSGRHKLDSSAPAGELTCCRPILAWRGSLCQATRGESLPGQGRDRRWYTFSSNKSGAGFSCPSRESTSLSHLGFDGVAGSPRISGPRSGCPATIEKHPDSGTVIPSLPASPTYLEFGGVAGSRRMTVPTSGCPATIEKHPDSGTNIPSLPASPTYLEFDGVAGSRRMTVPTSGWPATIEKHPDSDTVIPSLPASPTCLKFGGVAGSRRMHVPTSGCPRINHKVGPVFKPQPPETVDACFGRGHAFPYRGERRLGGRLR